MPPNGVVAADDFVPQGTTLTQLCVWGFYSDATLQDLGCVDAIEDEFRVRVFADNGGLPGTLLGESLVTGANISRGLALGTAFEDAFVTGTRTITTHGYTLTLDSPITTLVSGVRHWLEVANNTRGPTSAAQTCWWNWLQHYPPVGDGYSATGANSEGVDDSSAYLTGVSRYIHGSARMSDLAFCLGSSGGPLDFNSGAAVTAACWTCEDAGSPICTVETALDCVSAAGVDGIWNRLDPDCSGTLEDAGELILGDNCADPLEGARVITNGLYATNTNCANTDGYGEMEWTIKIPPRIMPHIANAAVRELSPGWARLCGQPARGS